MPLPGAHILPDLVEGDCVDGAFFNNMFDNIDAIRGALGRGSSRVSCVPINVSTSGRWGEEQCSEIRASRTSIELGDSVRTGSEKKLIMISLRFDANFVLGSESSNSGVNISHQVSIKCGGIETESKRVSGSAVFSVDCPPGDSIEICTFSTISGIGNGTAISVNVQICGSMICIAQESIPLIPGVFSPPAIRNDCCIGREGQFLLAQNLQALCNQFEFASQTIETSTQTFDNLDSNPIAGPFATRTVFLVLGSLEFCAFNPGFPNGASFSVTPAVGCLGSQVECFTSTLRLQGTDDVPQGDEACLSVPVIACGVCEAGESLFAGAFSSEACDGVSSALLPPIVRTDSLRQSYCIYTFSDQDFEFTDLADQGSDCATVEAFSSLVNKSRELEEAACTLGESLCLLRSGERTVDSGQEIILYNENEFVPAPGEPVPVYNWMLFGNFQACGSPGGNTETRQTARLQIEVFCGGNLVYATNPMAGTWLIADSGIFRQCSDSFLAQQCIQCPADQTLSVVGTVVGGFGFAPFTWTYSMEVVAFG